MAQKSERPVGWRPRRRIARPQSIREPVGENTEVEAGVQEEWGGSSEGRLGPERAGGALGPVHAGGARQQRWRDSRLNCASRSWARRSTAGRQVEVRTVGAAKTASSSSAGWMDASSATVTASCKMKLHVVKSDMYM